MHYSYSFDSLSIGATPGPEQDTMSPSTEPLLLAAEDSSVNETEVLVMVMFVSQEIFGQTLMVLFRHSIDNIYYI